MRVPGRQPKYCKRGNHGMYRTPTYISWMSMLHRCKKPDNENYKHYGARGIKVCKRWELFINFYQDMGERPAGKTLGRIDNSKGYNKKNCRWETASEQRRNSRQRINWLEYRGQKRPLLEWSGVLGIRANKIRYRLAHGWPVHLALSTLRYNKNREAI